MPTLPANRTIKQSIIWYFMLGHSPKAVLAGVKRDHPTCKTTMKGVYKVRSQHRVQIDGVLYPRVAKVIPLPLRVVSNSEPAVSSIEPVRGSVR